MTEPKNTDTDMDQNLDQEKELEQQDSLSKDPSEGKGDQDNLLFAIPAVSTSSGMLNAMDSNENPYKNKVCCDHTLTLPMTRHPFIIDPYSHQSRHHLWDDTRNWCLRRAQRHGEDDSQQCKFTPSLE